MLAPKLITGPAGGVVSLDEAKVQCRADDVGDIEDALISGYISAATRHIEKSLELALITQTWEQSYSALSECLRLPMGPVASVTSVNYFAADGSQQTLPSEAYELLADEAGPYVSMWPAAELPQTFDRPDAVTVRFVAGQSEAEVPRELKVAILLHVAFLYQFRESHLNASVTPTGAYEALVWPFKQTRV